MIFSTFDDRNIHCARRLNLVVDVLCAWIRAATPVFGDKCFTKIAPATRSMGDIRKILRPIGTRLTERLWAVLFASANNRRTALRRLFNHHMAPNVLAFITFDDHALFVDPRDQMIAFRLLSGHSWQRAEFEAAVTATEAVGALQPGKWFIDCGANIGTQTIYAMRSGKFCGAVAIEPEPHNLDLLRRNLAINGLSERVHVVAAAASRQSGSATLVRDQHNFGAHSIEPNWSNTPGSTLTVETRSIDSIMASFNIAPEDVGLVWIDVEGHEMEALQGMQRLRSAKVPIVSEVSLNSQGPVEADALRTLLLQDYTSAQHLHSLGAQSSRQINTEVPDSRSIADFEFGARQTDVLIFNTRQASPNLAE
jgi:FkbM family methyltransferase